VNNTKRMSGKVLQWNYDQILAASEQKCCYSLTRRDVALIMAISEQMHWSTRYLSPSGTEIDTDLIDAWASGMETRLMDGCCPDGTLSRFTDDGIFQTSVDGGETWQDAPDSDPRNSGTLSPPLPGSGDNVRCAASDNVRDNFTSMRDSTVALLTAGTTVLAILAGIVGLVGVILGLSGAATAIGVLLIGLSAELLSLTPESVTDQLDETTMDDFRCLVYCNMEDNGQFTYAGWQALISAISSTFTGFPLTFFMSITQSLGYIGMSNAGTMGAATASDCDGCDCDCDGETVGETLIVFHGTEISRTGCNLQVTATLDGSNNAVTITWDGVHSWKLTVEALISGSTGSSTWQWYTWDGSEHGPFTSGSAPIGVEVTTIELSGTPGNDFAVSWDVATP